MKKNIYHIFSLVIGFYFLVAGSGFNIIKYCCNTCEKEGIEYVTQHSCNEIHHHDFHNECEDNSEQGACHHEQNEDMACSNHEHKPTGCHILRLNITTPTLVSISSLVVNLISSTNLYYCIENLHLQHFTEDSFHAFTSSPPLLHPKSGRLILAYKSVLLI